jgi:poly [ADP-ribose] polymerase
MLGNGIYLADRSSKSTNYCSARRSGVPQMLLVVESALGNAYVAPDAAPFDRPPDGYDSVWGKAGYTRIGGSYTLVNNEFVVYSPAQQTIRYLVTFNR